MPDRQTRCQTKKKWSGFLTDQIFWSGPDRYLPTSDHLYRILGMALGRNKQNDHNLIISTYQSMRNFMLNPNLKSKFQFNLRNRVKNQF